MEQVLVRQTFGTTQKFNAEAVKEFRDAITKSLPIEAFLSFDSTNQLLHVECNAEVAAFCAKVVINRLKVLRTEPDDKISLGQASSTSDSLHETVHDGNNTICRRWKPKHATRDLMEMYTPDVVAKIAERSSTDIKKDDTEDVFVVTGMKEKVSLAIDNLDTLQQSMAALTKPFKSNNILINGPEDALHTRVIYKAVGEVDRTKKLLSMILADHDDIDLIATLSSMHVAFAASYDVEYQELQLPDAISRPRMAGENVYGNFRPWYGFEFTPIGDQKQIPQITNDQVSSKFGEYVDHECRHDMPHVEAWREAATNPVDAFAPNDKPLTSTTAPTIDEPKVGVAPPPSIADGSVLWRGKYRVRSEVFEDSDEDSEADEADVEAKSLLAIVDNRDQDAQTSTNVNVIPVADPFAGLGAFDNTSNIGPSPRNSVTPSSNLARGLNRTQAPVQRSTLPKLINFDDAEQSTQSASRPAPYTGGILAPSPSTPSVTPTISGICVAEAQEETSQGSRRFVRLGMRDPQYVAGLAAAIPENQHRYRATLDRLNKGPTSTSTERLQNEDEVNSREFHQTMEQQANRKDKQGQHKKGKTEAERAAIINSSWGLVPSSSESSKPLTAAERSAKYSKDFAENRAESTRSQKRAGLTFADGFQDELSSGRGPKGAETEPHVLFPALTAARSFTGQLSLTGNIGKLLIKASSVSRDNCKTQMTVKEFREFMNPGHGVRGPDTIFMDKVTTSGVDCSHIVDRVYRNGSRLFEEHPYGFEVVYEFLCKNATGENIVLKLYEEEAENHEGPIRTKYTLDRPTRPLGFTNYHFASHMWDARLTLNATPEYQATKDEHIAAQSFVDSIIVPAGSTSPKLYARFPRKEFHIISICMRRWTRFACASAAKASLLDSNDLYLEITEVQDLHWAVRADDPNQLYAYATSNEDMVKRNRLWYNVAVGSTTADNIFSRNVDLPLGCVADWLEKEIIGAGIITKVMNVVKNVVPKIDGVGYHNRGPRAGAHAGLGGSIVTDTTRPRHTVAGAYVHEGTYW